MRITPKAIKVAGFVMIAAYWASFLATSRVAGALEQSDIGSRAVLRLLWDVYRTPPMVILGSLRHVLPYPEFIFTGPLVAIVVGFTITCLIWWGFLRWRRMA